MNTSLSQILAIARITVKENLRNKAFTSIIIIGVTLFFAMMPLAHMAVGEKSRVVLDGGFWIIGISGLAGALFLCLNTIQREIKQKTSYLLFSRPMDRWVFILGKALGIFLVLLFTNSILNLFFILELYLIGISISYELLIGLSSIFLEWCVLAGFSLLFSVFTSPFLHGIFLTALYFIGHWTKDLYAYAENSTDPFMQKLLIVLYTVFPNLEALNYRSLILYNETIDIELLGLSLLTGSCWILTTIVVSIFIFTHKKLV